MPQSILILVRIAVLVPEKMMQPMACPDSIYVDSNGNAVEPPFDHTGPLAPGVTAEMLAFYHECPQSN